jgi:hypothetical protein
MLRFNSLNNFKIYYNKLAYLLKLGVTSNNGLLADYPAEWAA